MTAWDLRPELLEAFTFGMMKNGLKKKQRVDGEEPESCHVVWDQTTKEFKEGAAAASKPTELKNETAIEYHNQETIISFRRGISLW